MSELINKLVASASALNKKIVLTEGEDKRVVTAAAEIVKRNIAKIVLLGDEEQIKADNPEVDLTGIEIINPKTSPKLEEYSALLYELRKSKGMTLEQAQETACESTYFGTLMLKAGDVDGLVSGACH
ncbi:MAG: phosphate acetyltransferase, partial [Clostridia bacterium]|nr:phosphate acetyltransferase [Clostridia bacterium]